MSKTVKACASKRPRDAGDGWEERGGYMNAKKKKLKTQFSEHESTESTEGGLFTGIAIHVNGYTKPTSEELKRLMQQHGGKFIQYYNKTDVTHIIATSLTTSKINRLTNQKIVKPEWITESVDANCLLPYQDYVLFKPKWQNNPSVKHSVEASANQSAAPPNTATAGNPKFLEEFYNNSRLHHISSWGSECKTYVRQLQAANSFPGREKLLEMERRDDDDHGAMTQCIMHVDMDCFFVSVGLLKRPHLRGKPVAVTHSKGKGREDARSEENVAYEMAHWQKKHGGNLGSKPALNSMAEIASCSYEARAAGVKNGMFFGQARDLCADLVPIPYDYDEYKRVSRILYDTIASFTHDIEAVSCDELLVDLTSLMNEVQMSPLRIASMMRSEIEQRSKCTASAGIGPNILLAKMATKRAKPNGQHCIPDLTAGQELLSDRPVKDLPGVGRSIATKMAALSIVTCGDLQKMALNILQEHFGPKMGKQLKDFAQGKDERSITSNKQRKSVSAEVNYGIRFKQEGEVLNFVHQLSDEVHSRLREVKMKGKTITLKLKVRSKGAPVETAKFLGHGICDSVNKSVSLPLATNNPEVIRREAMALVRQMNFPADDLRGIGIQVSRLESEIIADGGITRSILQFTSIRQNPSTEHPEEKPDSPPTSSLPPPTSSLPPLPFLPSQMNSSLPCPMPSVPIDLPSPSQIDPTFLAALPPDIRSEVESACIASHQSRKPAKSSKAFRLPQPKKNHSPGKSPSKCITTKSPGKTTNHRRGKNRSPAAKNAAALPTKRATAAKQLIYANTPKVNKVMRSTAVTQPAAEQQVNFCGAVSLAEVKALLNEWIRTTEVPEEEDVVMVVSYIEALSEGKNLELLHNILMHIRKVIRTQQKKNAWLECLDRLMEQSQAIVKADYGHPLKIIN